ncbi:MAG: cytochrome P450 [Acidimicrobiales bacterium]|nr:cytochrome P450 [Acidimicrobiales bacterium]MDG2217629.1 cytochrome P450 [Acidimicrobiales bacterium]
MTENLPLVEGIDLTDPAQFANGIPQAAFTAMRERDGLSWVEGTDSQAGFWNVTRYADVVTASRDTETYSSAVGHIQMYDIDEDALDARASMIDMDPPIHTRLRRLVSTVFTPRHVQSYQDTIRVRVNEALDNLESAGGGEWMELVAKPIPIGVICDIVGVPETDHDYMVELSDHLVAGTSSEPLPADAYGNETELRLLPFNSPAAHGVNEYARDLANLRRTSPGDDLVTKWLEAEVEGEKLTESEFSNFFRLMIFAGNETTRSSMGHLALNMAEFPDEFNRVRADPSLIPTATEEVIRYSSAILYFRRTATRDCELSGTAIAKGEKIVMWYAAANFDPDVYDDPLRFDAGRAAPHVAFGGGGAHFCLGASLARLEIAVLIEELIRRDIQLEIMGEPTYVDSNFVNGLESVQVRIK